MRVIVCGGRNFNDEDLLNSVLEAKKVTHVIEGGAPGADTLAWRWARRNLGKGSEHISRFEARGDQHGRAAGPIRNQQMIDEGKPDAVIAFCGGRCTADMVRRAKRAGLPVFEIT